MTALAHLTCLEKLHKKICSKKYHLVEQGLYELEVKEAEVAKTGSIPTVIKIAYTSVMESLSPTAHPSLLANPFFFNSFFS